MPYGFDSDSRSAPHSALSAPAGAPDGSDEEPGLRPTAGNRNEPQQAATRWVTSVSCSQTTEKWVRVSVLTERIKNLKTAPGVGPIVALTWGLEIGDVSRFRSVKQAISYCGLCGDEKSSADKVLRTPLSKQRNKHIQSVLIEAAKLAPRHSPELALIHEREKQKGNANRATLAVARKMVAYLLAVDRRGKDFVPSEERSTAAA